MKRSCLLITVLVLAVKLSAADTNTPVPLKIGTAQADKFYDQEMTVTGKVASVSIRPKVTLINLDQPFPDSPFTLVVFPTTTNQFGDLKALDGKNVEAKGKIKRFHEKPEIVLDNTNQLKVIEAPVASTNKPAAK